MFSNRNKSNSFPYVRIYKNVFRIPKPDDKSYIFLRPDRVIKKLFTAIIDIWGCFSFESVKCFWRYFNRLEIGANTAKLKASHCIILFVGDTSFGESYGDVQLQLLKKKGYDYPLAKMRPLLNQSDLIICNLETPITDIKNSIYKDKKKYVHWTHIKKCPITLNKHRINTCSLANNHTIDYGICGLEQTIENLKNYDMRYFGAGLNEEAAKKPFTKIFSVGNKKIKVAVIGAFEKFDSYEKNYNFYAKGKKGGCYMLSPQSIRNQILNLKKQDKKIYIVVFVHWGSNYRWKNLHQTSHAYKIIRYGVDLIIGHGGHGMQQIEKYKGKWILYGLGNFVYLSRGRYEQMKHPPYSYTVQLIFANNGMLEKWIRIYPIFTNNLKNNFQTRPLTVNEFSEFTEILLKKSPLTFLEAKAITGGENLGGKYLQFKID